MVLPADKSMMSKYYADNDVNNPEHPEFDCNHRVPVTPKSVFVVHITMQGGDGARLGSILDDFADAVQHGNIDAQDGRVSAAFKNSRAWGFELDVDCADIDITVAGRLEDLDPLCESFARQHGVYVRVIEKATKKIAIEFNLPVPTPVT